MAEDIGMLSDNSPLSSAPSSPGEQKPNPIDLGHSFIEEVRVMREELHRLQPEPIARQFAKVEKKIDDLNVNLNKIFNELKNVITNNHQEIIRRQTACETNTQARIHNNSIRSDQTALYPLVSMDNEPIVPFPATRDHIRNFRAVPGAVENLLRKLGVDNIPQTIAQQLNLIRLKLGIAVRW